MKERGRLGEGVVHSWVRVNLFEVVKLFIRARNCLRGIKNFVGYCAVNMRCKWQVKSL
jgi:hypothetical protein